MPKHHARRLTRRLVTLLMLVAALATVSSNPPKCAAYDCELCEVMYAHCVSVCAPSCTAADEYRCENKRLACWASCD